MKICFKDKQVNIENLKFPIKTEYFKGCNNLIQMLNKSNIKYLKDLPEDLNELTSLNRVSERAVEKFLNQIILFEETIGDTGYIVFNKKKDIPVTLFNVLIEDLDCTNPFIDFLNDTGIKRIKDLPSDFRVLKNVNKIGPATIEKLITEILKVKEEHEGKKIFVTTKKNILIPDTLDLNIPLIEIDTNINGGDHKTLNDLPTDLRSLETPDFQAFIKKLENTIKRHKKELKIKEFENTFEALLKGKSAIGINERYAKVIKYRFGQPEFMSLQEIGNILGLTRERIRQIIDLVAEEVCRYYNDPFLFRERNIKRRLNKKEKEFLELIKEKARGE